MRYRVAHRRAATQSGLTQVLGRMKASTAVNLALALVPLGWALAVWGTLSQIGDYASNISPDQIRADHNYSMLALCSGILCLVTASWLSGYSFCSARLRSSLVAASVLIPLLIILPGMFQ